MASTFLRIQYIEFVNKYPFNSEGCVGMSGNCAVNLKNFKISKQMDAKVEQHKRNSTRLNRNQMVGYGNLDAEVSNIIRNISCRLMEF